MILINLQKREMVQKNSYPMQSQMSQLYIDNISCKSLM